ncbi:MAG: pyridoxamine 5'-phosphate oxidase family protein [Cyclobacteriaceae bacterium]
MKAFKPTEKTKITRLPKRGDYSEETIYSILDEALYCTLSWCVNGEPFQMPTGFCRIDNTVYVHGSVGSHYMRLMADQQLPVCIGATLMDGIVLARSAFHHSVNYRSVILFSRPRKVTDAAESYRVLEAFTEKMCKGRWSDVRKPTEGEWKATMALAFNIEEASAKVRVGPPKDDEEDYTLPVWAGVVPLKLTAGVPVPDPVLAETIPLPPYLKG